MSFSYKINGGLQEGKDADGNKMMIEAKWDEEKQEMSSECQLSTGKTVKMTRTIGEDGVMRLEQTVDDVTIVNIFKKQ